MKLLSKGIHYVFAQFFLIALILGSPRYGLFDFPYSLFFFFFFLVLGTCLLFFSFWALEKNFTPLPSLKENHFFVQRGPYRFVRHPMYSAVFLLALAWGFYIQTLIVFFWSLVLLILFYFKGKKEEKELGKRFESYPEYKKRTKMFFPYFF